MKEITDILKAYQKAVKANIRTALATVVHVEGSSYRRPGARMLITEDGILTGAISGGCLEGDALRKALSAIVQQKTKLITYDTTEKDDAEFGVQLGCNGIIHILFEPINTSDSLNPIAILGDLENEREDAILVTLFSMTGQRQPGTSMLYRQKGFTSKIAKELAQQVEEDANTALNNKTSSFATYSVEEEQLSGFLELIRPPISLIIAGAGNDAKPLAEIAYLLGWNVTIADGRPTHANSRRFANANRILVAKPEELMTQIDIDELTAFVLMTHNYNYDIHLLNLLLDTDAPYIGSLGPKKKLERMLDELGKNTEKNLHRVHGPVGLDIGAETAEEIAISIVAEIKSVFAGGSAGFLKEKMQPIHFHETRNSS